jgi:hypothetical protein
MQRHANSQIATVKCYSRRAGSWGQVHNCAARGADEQPRVDKMHFTHPSFDTFLTLQLDKADPEF